MRGMESVSQHAEENRGVVMEHRGTALPTCYRIFYYYGDFSVAPSFAQTVKERRIEQKERKLPQAKEEKQ